MSPFKSRRPGRHASPNTYFVQNQSQEELTRLHTQDEMVTRDMGGVLAEQPVPHLFQRVLDVGCGTGDWLIEVARGYPTMPLLMGIDINSQMVTFAREQAEKRHLSERVEFHVMDALTPLAFPTAYFDLVNQRLGISFLRTWDWPPLFQQYQRITRPGGTLRITEAEPIAISTSAALTQLCSLLLHALHQAGHLFTSAPDGLTGHLVDLVSRHGLSDVQTRVHPLQYRAGTLEGRQFFENERAFFRSILPFLHKWGRVPEDYEDLYQQALQEMQQPGFVATWNLLTIWGTMPRESRQASPTAQIP